MEGNWLGWAGWDRPVICRNLPCSLRGDGGLVLLPSTAGSACAEVKDCCPEPKPSGLAMTPWHSRARLQARTRAIRRVRPVGGGGRSGGRKEVDG